MTEIVLTRWWTDEHRAQVGRLAYPGGSCFTLEDPWAWNRVRSSCIPTGFYRIKRDTFKGQYPNFALVDVVGRAAIEMHIGNTEEATEGCILLGQQLWFVPEPTLAHSTAGFQEFMDAMTGIDDAVLAIVDGLMRPIQIPVQGGE